MADTEAARLREKDLATRLTDAVRGRNIKIAEDLLLEGASVHGSVEIYVPPLIVAAETGNAKMMKLLLDRGADPDQCIRKEIISPFEIRLARGTRSLYVAVLMEHLNATRMLLEAGANPNATDVEGNTPLMVLCRGRLVDRATAISRITFLRVLLDAGANPLLVQIFGFTAMHFAAGSNDVDLLDIMLRTAPSTLDRVSWNGTTPLLMAAEAGNAESVSRLLSAGASNKSVFELPNMDFACPLAAAVDRGHDEVVRVLLGQGMEAIGAVRAVGRVAFKVVSEGRANILRMILDAVGEEQREQLSASKFMNTSLLQRAVANRDLSIVRVLLAFGAAETACDAYGKLMMDIVLANEPKDKSDPKNTYAICSMLDRAPALLARSWLWPTCYATTKNASNGEEKAILYVRISRSKNRDLYAKILRGYFAT